MTSYTLKIVVPNISPLEDFLHTEGLKNLFEEIRIEANSALITVIRSNVDC